MSLVNLGKSLKIVYIKIENLGDTPPKFSFSQLLYLSFLFQPHLLEVNAKYYIQQFHLQIILYFFDNSLPLLLFYFQIFRSNPPVLNPNVFKSSCAINTYVLMLPCLINGYPALPQAGLPNLLSKCTQVCVILENLNMYPIGVHIFCTFLLIF